MREVHILRDMTQSITASCICESPSPYPESGLFNVFPGFVVAVAANYTLYLCLRPTGADKVAIRRGICGLKTDPQDPEVIDYIDLRKSFNVEDKEKLETLQQAQNTRYYHSGPLAPDDLEGMIWDFLNYMGRMVESDRELVE